ncbi:MAG: heat-inducible transcription repressor HrcA [Ignavibacteria bacterium]|jgi:heat-inducible transcriptional repressor|nr:heat-inducible transcription repressor HrcA [Ignavibacteria bacterium]
MNETLTDREKEVLKYVVENFIRIASPIGSRSVSKKTDLHLSSATIRNVMSDLEEMDLLNTPHTSAGRIPTDKGYRYYVDMLMNSEKLNLEEEYRIKSQFDDMNMNIVESRDLYIETSRILGKITHLLSVVSQPLMSKGVFDKLEFVSLASNKILVVLNIRSGMVKTVIMEIDSEIPKSKLDDLSSFLNERLQGLTLDQIRVSIAERVKDYNCKEPELIRLFVNSLDKLYTDEEKGNRIYVGGTGDLIMQPEFEDPKNFKEIINLAEDKNLVIHIFQNSLKSDNEVLISIGSENEEERLKNYSVVTTSYNAGNVKGNIGVIGPKRMNYARMISLLQYTSKIINERSI